MSDQTKPLIVLIAVPETSPLGALWPLRCALFRRRGVFSGLGAPRAAGIGAASARRSSTAARIGMRRDGSSKGAIRHMA